MQSSAKSAKLNRKNEVIRSCPRSWQVGPYERRDRSQFGGSRQREDQNREKGQFRRREARDA